MPHMTRVGRACAGEKLVELVGWLRAGGLEKEAGLLKALAQAPLPRLRDPAAAPGAGEAGAGPVARHLDLEQARAVLVGPQSRVTKGCVPLRMIQLSPHGRQAITSRVDVCTRSVYLLVKQSLWGRACCSAC